MLRKEPFFELLCTNYYDKILHYLFYVLKNETAARDCTQDVFLVALEKESILSQHPNAGGFLFQTAKNLSKKHYRTSFQKMINEFSSDEKEFLLADDNSSIELFLDQQIDERDFIDDILSGLSPDKRHLYSLYYVEKRPMAEIAQQLSLEPATLRMRYVRLRREIIDFVKTLSEKEFSV